MKMQTLHSLISFLCLLAYFLCELPLSNFKVMSFTLTLAVVWQKTKNSVFCNITAQHVGHFSRPIPNSPLCLSPQISRV